MSDVDPLSPLRRSRRPLRAPFMLTPLIDVLFLLLIFFMLTSQTSPFAMLIVSTAGRVVEEPAAADGAGAMPQLLVQVENGRVAINGVAVAPANLSDALADYATTSPVVVLLGRSASVQDAVGILEVLTVTGFSSVQVASRGGS